MSEHGGSPSVERHHREAPRSVPVFVITVSDSRTLASDRGGALLVERLTAAGHSVVARRLVPDEPEAIRKAVREALERDDVRAVVLTGGTGITGRDVTPEAVGPLLEREIPGFGELFRSLSFQRIGAAAMLSRAFAGVARARIVVALPGSPAGVELALEELLLPELGHLVAQAARAD